MRHFRAPKGWRKRTLEDLAKLQTGVSKSNGRSLTNPIVVPYLRVANVQDGFVDLSEIKTIRLEASTLPRYQLQTGDVLLTEGGDFDKLGRGCVWRGQVEPCVHQNHVFVVRPDPGKLLPDFFAAQAGSTYGRNFFLACAKQTTNLASINSTQLKQFPVLLPPIDEQRRIVAVLSAWDRGIEQLERLIAAKERRKRGLMQQLLTGKRRLPEFNEVWSNQCLSALVQKTKGAATLHNNAVAKIPYIGSSAMSSGETQYTSSDGGAMCSRSDVLLLWDGEYCGKAATGIIGAVGSTVARLQPKGSLEPLFLYAHLTFNYYRIRTIREGSGIPHLPGDFLKLYVLRCPPLEEQRRIAAVLNACDEELRQHRAQLAALKRQKKGLMQKLLTGEVRVPEALNDRDANMAGNKERSHAPNH